MVREGNLDPASPIAELIQSMLPETLPSGVKFAIPFIVIEDLVAGAVVNSVQNPSDSDCVVAAVINITTGDATETMDVGIDSDGTTSDDTLLDALDIATAGAFSSFSDADTGTNGVPWRQIDKKGGTNDRVVFTCSAGTDALVGQIVLIFIPLNK